jgi:hypothetical protein
MKIDLSRFAPYFRDPLLKPKILQIDIAGNIYYETPGDRKSKIIVCCPKDYSARFNLEVEQNGSKPQKGF